MGLNPLEIGSIGNLRAQETSFTCSFVSIPLKSGLSVIGQKETTIRKIQAVSIPLKSGLSVISVHHPPRLWSFWSLNPLEIGSIGNEYKKAILQFADVSIPLKSGLSVIIWPESTRRWPLGVSIPLKSGLSVIRWLLPLHNGSGVSIPLKSGLSVITHRVGKSR